MNQQLIKKIENKTSVIGIIGLGYVGLPLMLRFVDAGYKVLGFDNDYEKIEKLNKGDSYIEYITPSIIANALQFGFEATIDLSRAKEVDAIIICVPTPLNKYREPDLSYVKETIDTIAPYLNVGQVIILESTTYPGTTEEELLPRIQSQGLTVGEDIFLVYSPEREDPGNQSFDTYRIPKVVGGHTKFCLDVGKILYQQVIEQVVVVSSTTAAEMTKLLENIYRAVNIGLVNEMKMITDRMGINIHEVINAASTKPFGYSPFYPGPGLGGHCIPVDPFYLAWKTKEYGMSARFIELAGEINSNMPHWVINKTIGALNDIGKSLKNSKVLMLGIAYKKNIDDIRESPAVDLMKLLEERGAIVNYTDPHIPIFPKNSNHHFDLSSVTLSPEIIQNYDFLILATDHAMFDYEMLRKHAKIIIDTRGVYTEYYDNIIKA